MQRRRWIGLLLAGLLWAAPAWAAYTPVLGIPAPPIDTDVVTPSRPGNWPTTEATGFYYIDNTHGSATDTANTYGYPNRPRLTIPTTFAAGSYVEWHGGPYTGTTLTITVNGTAESPVWITGLAAATDPDIRRMLVIAGQHARIEYLDSYSNTARFTIGNGADYILVRHSKFHSDGTTRTGGCFNVSGTSTNFATNNVAYNNEIYEYGDDSPSSTTDSQGFRINTFVDGLWLIDNHVHNNGADAVILGQATYTQTNRPRNIYIGRNHFHDDRENAIDIKGASDIIISQNTMHGYGATATSNGEVIRVNDEGWQNNVAIIFNTIYDGDGCVNPANNNSGSTTNGGGLEPIVLGNRLYGCGTAINDDADYVAHNIITQGGLQTVTEAIGGAGAISIHGNIIVIGGGTAIFNAGGGCTNNLVYTAGTVAGGCSGGSTADPLLTKSGDLVTGYSAGSPAIDSSTEGSAYAAFATRFPQSPSITKDFSGTSRPQNGTWDRGAFEYVAGGGGDTDAPVITAVSAGAITDTGATIAWTTNEASSSRVNYGTTTSYGTNTTLDASLVTSHSQALTGLTASTLYHFRVRSADAAANEGVSGDFTFTTAAAPDVTPPTISAIAAINVTQTAITLTWSTNEAATSQVTYGTADCTTSSTTETASYVTSHSVTVSGLTATTTYKLCAKSVDASANSTTSAEQTITTANPADVTAPVISAEATPTIDERSVVVTWSTNENATSQVEYGLTAAYGASTTLDTNTVTSHSVIVTGLEPGTLYHYRVKSKDAAENLATGSDQTFQTDALQLPTLPPSIDRQSSTSRPASTGRSAATGRAAAVGRSQAGDTE